MMKNSRYQIDSEISYTDIIVNIFKKKIYDFLFNKSPDALYTRGSDFISKNQRLFGIHERELIVVIRHISRMKSNAFFIDIGANIGLVSCSLIDFFKKFYLYEINPLAFNILKTNIAIKKGIDSTRWKVHSFGLGKKESEDVLVVPRSNFGGAFVDSYQNTYDQSVLLKKEGLKSFDDTNTFRIPVKMQSAEKELTKCFLDAVSEELDFGVVKIDIEGMETTVLSSLFDAYIEDLELVVIFENWSKLSIQSSVGSSWNWFVVEKKQGVPKGIPRFFRTIYGWILCKREKLEFRPIQLGGIPPGMIVGFSKNVCFPKNF